MSFNPHQWYLNGLRFVGDNNTFIGGVSSVINTPDILALKLRSYPISSTFNVANIKNFTIVGNDIQCYIGVDYILYNNAFANTNSTASSPTSFIDTGGFCKQINGSAFYNSLNTSMFYFPGCLLLQGGVFYHAFSTGIDPRTFYFPSCTYIGDPATADTTTFGFSSIAQKYYANTFLQTNNSGGVDATLAHSIADDTLAVSYILNSTAPSQITNLTIGTITATTLQLNFTAPSSLNTIDFYEVWLNGVRTNKTVTASGQNITGLTTATLYDVQLKAVDVYYNKSELSNTASSTTL